MQQKQGGWEVYEGEGVCPVYCDETAREDALSYARQRAGYAPKTSRKSKPRCKRSQLIGLIDSSVVFIESFFL